MIPMNPGAGRPMGTALRPPGRPPIRRNGPPLRPRLAEMAAGIPNTPEPSPVGRTLGGIRTGPAISAPQQRGATPGPGPEMFAALARLVASRRGGRRG